jgi:hypothetical protein
MRQDTLIERAATTLFENSNNQVDIREAVAEWIATGKVIDNGEDVASDDGPPCELCHHENLRWQFEIRNRVNENLLLVGSTCINHFDIPMVSNGTLQYGNDRNAEMRRRVSELKKDQRREKVLTSLRALWRVDKAYRWTIEDSVKRWKESGTFRAIDMSMIASRLRHNRIDHDPGCFDVRIKGSERELDHMGESEILGLLPYL